MADRKLTPEERRQALRYNQMMYGPSDRERQLAPKRVDWGGAFLKHPRFQALLEALRKGNAASFEVSAGGRSHLIATNGAEISFDARTVFYTRPMNRYEDHLLVDRAVLVFHEANEVLAHLVFAVMRSLVAAEAPPLNYLRKAYYLGSEPLDANGPEGSNLLLGAFRHAKPMERPRK